MSDEMPNLTWREYYERSRGFPSESSLLDIVEELKIKRPKEAVELFWVPADDDIAMYSDKELWHVPDRGGPRSLLWSVLRLTPKQSIRVEYFRDSSFGPVMPNLFEAYNVLLFAGSGISLPFGVPGMAEVIDRTAELLGHHTTDLSLLFAELKEKETLLSKFITWFHKACEPAKQRLLHSKETMPHYIAIKLWRDRYIDTFVTTNWDMLFEQSAKLIEWSGQENVILGKKFLEVVYGKKHLTSWTRPSWTIVSHPEDLVREAEGNFIRFFKIHGSPSYYFCPECRGENRWKEIPEGVSTPHTCSEHSTALIQDIVVPNQIDKADSRVLSVLDRQFARADVILCVGYSGKDEYLFERFFEKNSKKLIVVDPNPNETSFTALTDPIMIKANAEDFLLEVGDWLFSRDTRERADPVAERQARDLLAELEAKKLRQQRMSSGG